MFHIPEESLASSKGTACMHVRRVYLLQLRQHENQFPPVRRAFRSLYRVALKVYRFQGLDMFELRLHVLQSRDLVVVDLHHVVNDGQAQRRVNQDVPIVPPAELDAKHSLVSR